jgi:hypothetical protein
MTTDVPVAGAPTVITASCRPVMQGWTPSLVEPCHRPAESLLQASVHLGMLLCHDARFCWSIGVGLHLLHMRWPSTCESSSLPVRAALTTWGEGLAAFARALGEVHMECDDSHARADVVQRDFFPQARASNFWSKQLTDPGRALE